MSINSKRWFAALIAPALFAAAVSPSQAGWWLFGKSLGRPQLSRVYAGGIEIGRGEAKTDLYRNHLREGRLEIKGFFRAAPKAMAAQVRVSLDGGATWDDKVELASDSFLYSFQPAPERPYHLQVRIVDVKGQENDPGDLSKAVFVYHALAGERIAEDGLRELARRYSNRDYRGFADLIAADYRGDAGSLADAAARDFKAYSSINLSVVPSRTLIDGSDARIDFRYDETLVRSTDAFVSRTSGQASYTVRLEDGKYKLYQMPSPALFGITAPPGDNPGVTTGGGSGLQQKSGQAGSTPFDFKSGQNASSGDVSFDGFSNVIAAVSPAAIQSLGPVQLESVGQAPASGYSASAPASVDTTYAVSTHEGTYALFQITSIQGSGPAAVMHFNYLYQPNGTRTFQ